MMPWMRAESNTTPAREKQRALCVAIHLPIRPHTVITNKEERHHRATSVNIKPSSNVTGSQVTTRDSHITKENKMSRRGIHPLLMGLDRPQRAATPKHPVQTSGLESAQRKRYLRLEAEEAETSTSVEA